MNSLKLKSALSRHLEGAELKNDDELADAIAKDDKQYKMNEQQEIFSAIRAQKPFKEVIVEPKDDEEDQKQTSDIANYTPISSDPTKRTSLTEYFKYAVKPVVGTMKVLDPKSGRMQSTEYIRGYARKGECLQRPLITDRHAKRLNAQTPNSEFYFFTKEELELEFIAIENF